MARCRLLATLAVAAVLTTAALMVDAAPAGHEITELPGWAGALPSKMYSGIISAGSEGDYKMFEHYMFVECELDPTECPLVIWTNGGPGASSMFGLFVELGPFTLEGRSLQTPAYNTTKIPTLFENPYSWTKVANVLILNSPPPVGFSYCEPAGVSGKGTSCGSWNDTRTAVHNYEFLVNWYKAFPEYLANDLYITGESYAGIYVPMLAQQIVSDPQSTINLKGIAVGDGCVGTEVLCGPVGGPFWNLEFMYGHGQFSTKLYDQIMAECPRDQLVDGPVTDKACKELIAQSTQEIGGYYGYNLYDECWYQQNFDAPSDAEPWERTYWGPPPHGNPATLPLKQALNDYPCGGNTALTLWVDRAEVRKALHVDPDSYFFSGDNGEGFVYNLTETSVLPFYRYLTENTTIRVLIYNGDTDPGINSFRTQNWTSYMGFPVREAWRPWTLDGHKAVAGYVTRYSGDFDFLTIRGSGHMVPEFQPAAALKFLTSWLNNEDWPVYDPTPKRGGPRREL